MKTSALDKAFENTPRANFLPEDVRYLADYDEALPIGYGQTNSQPFVVRQMLKWLDVRVGQKVLDVGSGSGWTSALLANLVGDKGKVTAVEIVPELVQMGKLNCKATGVKNVTFHKSGKVFGWPASAPYDRILVSASADYLPDELIDQLAPGGRIVIPVEHDILIIDKDNRGKLTRTVHEGYVFVPLVRKRG